MRFFKISKLFEWLLHMPLLCPPFKMGFPLESRTHPLQSALCTKYCFFSWLYCSTPTDCQEYSKAELFGSTTRQTHEEQTFNFSHMCPYCSHWMGYNMNLFSGGTTRQMMGSIRLQYVRYFQRVQTAPYQVGFLSAARLWQEQACGCWSPAHNLKPAIPLEYGSQTPHCRISGVTQRNLINTNMQPITSHEQTLTLKRILHEINIQATCMTSRNRQFETGWEGFSVWFLGISWLESMPCSVKSLLISNF